MENTLQMLRLPDVMQKTGLSRAAIYAKQNPKSKLHDSTFPKGVKLSANTTAWICGEIDAWLQARIAASRTNTSKEVAA